MDFTEATKSGKVAGAISLDFILGANFSKGIGAPKNTPAEIIDRLNKEINAGLADPKIQIIAEEAEKGGKIIRAANGFTVEQVCALRGWRARRPNVSSLAGAPSRSRA